MSRLLSTIQNDMIIQVRKKFYSVTLILALLFAVVFSLIFEADQIRTIIPAAMLLIVGGTSLIFVGGLIIEEKDKGILNALVLSPLTTKEYLWSKIISLTFLSTLEVGIMIAGPIIWFGATENVAIPQIGILSLGIISLNLIYTQLGLALTVRFRKTTDYMIPVVVIMIFLQIPITYYAGIINHWVVLIIPSAAPVMLIQGAFIQLSSWEWIYSLSYIAVQITILTIWSRRAFTKHIIERMA